MHAPQQDLFRLYVPLCYIEYTGYIQQVTSTCHLPVALGDVQAPPNMIIACQNSLYNAISLKLGSTMCML